MAYGDDDTFFFLDAVLDVLGGLDPAVPYFLTGAGCIVVCALVCLDTVAMLHLGFMQAIPLAYLHEPPQVSRNGPKQPNC